MTDRADCYPWIADLQDGTYRNPILFADYSDPDVARDGEDYWMTASSFNCTPGLPILHSRDLVNWSLVNHAVENLPDPREVFHLPRHGEGVWAPAIRKHDGKFWIFFPMPDEGLYVTTADDPAGKWSEPHLLIEGKGLIDPCPLWDDDGRAYLVHAYANSRAGIKHKLHVRPMAPDGSKLLGEGRIVFDEPERHPTCEGPKFLKRNGWYYIAAPAGGVATGWQLILRSRDIYGPYEEKVVLAQGMTDINGPHQGAIIDTPGGQWWFIHFQEHLPYGRIVHLQPVHWEDDWPLMGINQDANGTGEPVLRHTKPDLPDSPIAIPPTTDDFTGERLGLQWQWHANHPLDGTWHTLGDGHLRLHAVATADDFKLVPNQLLQKFPAPAFAVETAVRLDEEADKTLQAGLIVMGRSHAAVAVDRRPGHPQLVLLVNNRPVASRPLRSPSARLGVRVAEGGLCRFALAEGDGPLEPIGDRFQAEEGHWIGAKVGLFCRVSENVEATGGAVFEPFRFSA